MQDKRCDLLDEPIAGVGSEEQVTDRDKAWDGVERGKERLDSATEETTLVRVGVDVNVVGAAVVVVVPSELLIQVTLLLVVLVPVIRVVGVVVITLRVGVDVNVLGAAVVVVVVPSKLLVQVTLLLVVLVPVVRVVRGVVITLVRVHVDVLRVTIVVIVVVAVTVVVIVVVARVRRPLQVDVDERATLLSGTTLVVDDVLVVVRVAFLSVHVTSVDVDQRTALDQDTGRRRVDVGSLVVVVRVRLSLFDCFLVFGGLFITTVVAVVPVVVTTVPVTVVVVSL